VRDVTARPSGWQAQPPAAFAATASEGAEARRFTVLGVETSCDETAVALIHTAADGSPLLAWQEVYSQTAMHAEHGGVVPELAARDHLRRLPELLERTLEDGGAPDLIAYTGGPGLLGALLVGGSMAAGLAAALGVPRLAIHHLEAHLLVAMLAEPALAPPFLALLVSGGHTLLVQVHALGRYEILGESIDDAVGEAFDKSAKHMGLGYPGGARLSELARQGRPGVCRLPRPLLGPESLDFSFSGLKTAMRLAVDALPPGSEPARADLARGFEEAVVETLLVKLERALRRTGLRQVVLAGGVAANRPLREGVAALLQQRGGAAHYPPVEWCTDNAVMVAYAGWLRGRAGQTDGEAAAAVVARARWPLDTLEPPQAPVPAAV